MANFDECIIISMLRNLWNKNLSRFINCLSSEGMKSFDFFTTLALSQKFMQSKLVW